MKNRTTGAGHRATEKRDELAPPHSITSSARASNGKGTISCPVPLSFWGLSSRTFVGRCWPPRDWVRL